MMYKTHVWGGAAGMSSRSSGSVHPCTYILARTSLHLAMHILARGMVSCLEQSSVQFQTLCVQVFWSPDTLPVDHSCAWPCRSAGLFSFSASSSDLTAVVLLCAVAFPLADPALYQLSLWAEKVRSCAFCACGVDVLGGMPEPPMQMT